MTKRLATQLLLSLASLAGCKAEPSQAETSSHYYINYEYGKNTNSGRSPEQAWKHSPGDPLATGLPQKTRLTPGSRVIFASGVIYRGEIKINESDTKEKPIIFESDRKHNAIIDGSDPIIGEPCQSSSECGNIGNWAELVRIRLTSALSSATIFSSTALLREAIFPNPKDEFYLHEPSDMLSADPKSLQKGEVSLPQELNTALLNGNERIAL